MKSINYGGVAFPRSLNEVPPYASGFDAAEEITNCSLAELLKRGRPKDLHVQRRWILRFIDDMHWLPLIEALSGCHQGTDPSAHAVFMKQLEAQSVLRVAHQLNVFERWEWGQLLRCGLKRRVPDPEKWESISMGSLPKGSPRGDILFVGDECVAAAEQARPTCLSEPPWLFYKAVAVVKGRLEQQAHDFLEQAAVLFDPSGKAYFDFTR